MSKFSERENKRTSVVQNIVDVQATEKKEGTNDFLARTFYIEKEHVKALAFEKAETGKDLSQIVREALNLYFDEKLDNYR